MAIEVTNGQPAYECGDTILAAWISGIPPELSPVACVFTPRVTWTLRLHHCVDVNDPDGQAEAWHKALQLVVCGLTTFLVDEWCANCPTTYDGGTVFEPSGNQIVADLFVTLEESCTTDA